MHKSSLVLVLFALTALAMAPGTASAQYCGNSPYAYWAGPLSAPSNYTLDYVPYFVRFPPVYYGYSMLLPQGEGFTTRSYSPNRELIAEPQSPLVLANPYVTPDQARPISLHLTAYATRIKNPFVLP